LVRELFTRFNGNAVRIQDELDQQYGHRVPYASLTHLIRSLELRQDASVRRSGTFVYPPGAEAQHDTSPHYVRIGTKRVKAQCASLALANCRLLFIQYYPRFTRFEAKIFLSAALDYMSGVPATCIVDNTSVLVVAGTGPDAIIAPEMEAFGAIYGMRFVAHERGHADRSAIVERNFHFVENNFLPGEDFADFAALNAAARSWCDRTANNKFKRSLGMSARQAYQSERPFLKPLPAVKPPVYQTLSRSVDLYGYVSVDTYRYSVPERLCGKLVEVHKGLYDLRIFHRHRLVATHRRRLDQRDAKITANGHHPPVQRTSKNRLDPLRRRLTGHSQSLDTYVTNLAARHRGSATRQLQRLLSIKRDYPDDAFHRAVARALHYRVYDLDRLEKIVLRCVAGDFFDLDPYDDYES